MFQTLIDCEINLHKNVEAKCERNEPIDIKEISSCFAIDVIGSSAFGLECKTFEQENSDFRVYGRKLFAKTTWGKLINIFSTNFPKLANALNIKTIPNDVSDFFMTVVENIISYREQNEFIRNDFMQSLIKMKNSRDPEKRLTGEEVAAQCAVFFVANFETSSTLMTFALFELAKNQYIQEKVRNEINKLLNKYNGSITYDFIDELKYMNQVLDEILRKYPPVPFIRRRCVKDYKIPDEDIVIEKGTIVVIPILGIHHDKEYYPDPDKFDPERFSEENKSCRHHYAHLPFGEGPRICIGKRFGLMQSKVGLTSLLKNYRFTLNKETKEPLTVDLNSMVLETEEKIWLDVQKI
ncbi:p450 domain containing protein [Asbolus verrucosus]|uniref:p450 domain containing protein n=1 Tax=Asbolus verrucosus TaxID=1661398 RepID=A0A482VRM4_ASBVE|nr:p450 domain containing protein [Asbolus verrucosus]